MKPKITQFIPVILALLAIGFRYFSVWCIFTVRTCYGTSIDHISLTVTKPLFYFSLFLLPITIILAFVPRSIFISWLKLAAWAIPLSILYIAMTPVIDNSLLPFQRDDAARLAGGVFAGVSLLLIIWRSLSREK